MNKELHLFLNSWLSWAENGGTTDGFDKTIGLCANVHLMKPVPDSVIAARQLQEKMYEHFKHNAYPFGGVHKYLLDASENRMHTNIDRLNWVRSTIKELEENGEV